MSETIGEIRRRAWETRRDRYGQRGHSGSYSRSRASHCADCDRMRDWLICLHIDGTLSEGQVAKATGLYRLDVRKIADEITESYETTAAYLRRSPPPPRDTP